MILFNENLTLKQLTLNVVLNVIVYTIAFICAFALISLAIKLWGANLIELQNFLGSGRSN